MNLRKAGIVAVLVLTALLGSSVMASATQTKKIKSSVKITKTSPKFKGKVSSPNKACIADRTVKLYAVEPGNEVVGSAKTDKHGKWKIQFQGDGIVHYYAKVLKRSEGAAGTIYVCKHARSEKVLQANAKSKATTVYKTDLKLSAHFPTFHGKVKADVKFCVGNRKVRMFRKVLGHGDSNDKLLGKTQSKGNGQWRVKYDDVSSGAYYAKVGKLESAAISVRCRADRSNILAAD